MVTVITPPYLGEPPEVRTARIEERAAVIRRLCKGPGIAIWRDELDVDPELFGVSTAQGVRDALVFVVRLLPQSPASLQAISSALFNERPFRNTEPDAKLLQARRAVFAEARGISMRTVMRLEEEGALLMSEAVDQHLYRESPLLVATYALALAAKHSTRTARTHDIDQVRAALQLVYQARI